VISRLRAGSAFSSRGGGSKRAPRREVAGIVHIKVTACRGNLALGRG
jgi:hypothetical protein